MSKSSDKPRLPSRWIFPVWRKLVWMIAWLRYDISVYGEENIPAPAGELRSLRYRVKFYWASSEEPVDTHGFVLAPRHHSLADIVAVGAFWRPFVLIAKPFFAMIPGIRRFFVANGMLSVFRPGIDDQAPKWLKFITPLLGYNLSVWVHTMLVAWRRRVSLTGEEMIEQAIRAAKLGIPIEIYPEGTREGGGNGRFGVFRIAMEAGVPLLPAGIYYGSRHGWLLRRQVCMVIGAPMELPECSFDELSFEQKAALAKDWDVTTDGLREQAKQLLDQ